MYERILVTTDGSALSRAAVEHVLRLVDRAAGSASPVTVLTVAETLPRFPGQAATVDPSAEERHGLTEQMAAELTAGPHADAELFRAALAAAGVSRVGVAVVSGAPGETIAAYARDGAFDVVVMATHGRSGLARTLLGSVADHVVSHLQDVPIVLIRPTADQETSLAGAGWEATAAPALAAATPYRRVLVGLDGSPFALGVLPAAIRACDAAGQIDLVQVIDALPRALQADADEANGETSLSEREARAALERAQANLEAARARAATLGAGHVETSVLAGTPEDVLVDYARTRNVDLVAMTTHGRSGVARSVLGSVPDAVLRHLAGTPVLLLHARR